MNSILSLRNAECAALDALPLLPFDSFRDEVISQISTGGRITAWFGLPSPPDSVRLIAVVARDADSQLALTSTEVRTTYPSLTPKYPQLHLLERELYEQTGILPEGHPWLKPVRFPPSGAPDPLIDAPRLIPYQIEGEEVHEVAVGPVHAGVIEPGHFRFQCAGEMVHHLEISLGYQHRGIERAMLCSPNKMLRHYVETASGDSSIGHMLAYCQLMETLSGTQPPHTAQRIRGIALELERLACHTGDLGALAGDVGYLPTSSFCGRLRGDFLNMTALLCGNRFGRNLLCPGGVLQELDTAHARLLNQRLDKTFADVKHAINLLWNTPSVLARFEHTGTISQQTAREIGLVGPAARACGLEQDVRYQFPHGIYTTHHLPISFYPTGDVFSRAQVRWQEIQRSYDFIKQELRALATGPVRVPFGPTEPNRIAVSLVEAWRGEVCHAAVTGPLGELRAL